MENMQVSVMSDDQAFAASSQAAEVFSPRTPVNRRALFAGRWNQMNAIADAVAQPGLHAVIFGERGVGKSSLANVTQAVLDVMKEEDKYRVVIVPNANHQDSFSSVWVKALDQISLENETTSIGFNATSMKSRVSLREKLGLGDPLSIDDVRRALSTLPNFVFVIDEFDRLPKKHVSQFTDLIKALSDAAVPSTVILVGVAGSIDEIVRDHRSIARSLIQIHMPRMSDAELREILTKASQALGMNFDDDALSRVTRMSQGLPHYTHLVGQHAVRHACDRRSFTVTLGDVDEGFKIAVKQADHTVAEVYGTATHSAHSGALFKTVLLACAVAACKSPENALGYFQAVDVVEPLSAILKKRVEIANFNGHLSEFISEKRAKVLERTGQARTYRYRFQDPLVPAYVILRSIADNLITADEVEGLLT